MRAFISVLELAEETGRTVAYVLARAVSDPGAVTLSVRTAGWPHSKSVRVHYGQEEGWRQVAGAFESLADITVLTAEVVAEQLLVDGVLRMLAPAGESLETCRVRLDLQPPRALNPAQLLLDAESARAIRAESSRGTLRDFKLRSLRAALERGRFRLTTTEASERLYSGDEPAGTKRKRLERLVAKAPPDLPSPCAVGGKGGRRLFSDDPEALALWHELAQRPSSGSRPTARPTPSPAPEESPQGASAPLGATDGERDLPSAADAGALSPPKRGSLRSRRPKGRS